MQVTEIIVLQVIITDMEAVGIEVGLITAEVGEDLVMGIIIPIRVLKGRKENPLKNQNL